MATLFAVGFQAYMMREQTRAATWPHLSIIRSFNENTLRIAVRNDGVGPARGEAVAVRIGAQMPTRWREVFAILNADMSETVTLETFSINRSVFFPGEFRTVVSINSSENLSDLIGKFSNVKGIVCYCSVLNDCFIAGDEPVSAPSKDRCDTIRAMPQFAD